MPLITRLSSTRSLPRISLGKCGSIRHHCSSLTLAQLKTKAKGEFFEWLCDRRNRRVILFRLEACGYATVRTPDAKDGAWKIQSERQTVYAKSTLAFRDQITAARRLASDR